MMKKEKLEQMKELGRGGLSKGLTMLRNAAEKAAAAAEAANEKNAQHAAIGALDDSSSSSDASASASAGGNGGNRLTYDELVTLSMKLTRQNKMMKAQFQKIQARINALSVKEANASVLTDFVKNVVGVDLDACHVDETKSSSSSSETAGDAASSSEQPSAAAKATIDAAELKQRYEIQHELSEREHRRVEERLRAELAALRSRTESNGSKDAALAPSDVESVSLLPFSPVGAPPAPELQSYDEIDLFNEPFPVAPPPSAPAPAFPAFDTFASSISSDSSADAVARLEKQLADVRAELEHLRTAAERRTREHNEQTAASTNALAQRAERVSELEAALAELQRTLDGRESSEEAWRARWDEQAQTLAGLRDELALKVDAASSLAAENATVAAQLVELKTALAAATAPSSAESDRNDSSAVARLTADVAQLNETIASLEGSIATSQASLEQARSDKDALVSAHSALKTELDAKRSEIETLRREIASLEQAAHMVSTTATDPTEADQEFANLKDTVASLTSTLAGKDAQVAALESALASARAESDQLRDAAAAVKADSSNEDDHSSAAKRKALDAELAQVKDVASTLAQENESLKAKLSAASEPNGTASAGTDDVAALLDELERVKMARAEVDHALHSAQDKLRVVEAHYKAAHEELEGSRSLVDALKADTSRLVDELAASERSRAQVQTEIDALASAKAAVDEELGVLRHDTNANLEQTLSEVEALKTQVTTAELEKVQAESRMAEEREYLKSKIESLIKEHTALDATLADKDKQVAKMAASQASMTAEMMELQTQLASMREDLHMAAEGLEAHAMRAEQSDLKRHEVEGKMANMKLQMDAMRDQHCTDFEMLRHEKEGELERVKLDRQAIAQKLSALETKRSELETSVTALERAYRDEQARVAELEAIVSQQTTEIGNLSVDLAETKKALSDRMGLATRLQTENMGIAAKQAEQAALIENALKDAATSRAKTDAMAAQLSDATAAMTRATALKDETIAAMQAMEREMAAQTKEIEAAQARAAAQFQADVDAERAACKREIERIDAESKHKSKLALQAVLAKEAEIARLSTRLAELEEDVRSGDADHRKIFEVAQLQAKREAESRAQALQLQDMAAQLDDAQQQIQRLQDEKLAHESELTALMQTQRREGVNMEYLKNVVVQYMSFRPGSSQQSRLVPVLSTLLQFSARDMREIKNASSTRRSSWTSWGTEPKDYKPILDGKGQRHSMLPPSPSPGLAAGGAPPSARASSFTLPHAMESASSDPSAFASHASSESHDF